MRADWGRCQHVSEKLARSAGERWNQGLGLVIAVSPVLALAKAVKICADSAAPPAKTSVEIAYPVALVDLRWPIA